MIKSVLFRLTALVLVLCMAVPLAILSAKAESPQKFGTLLRFLEETERQWPAGTVGRDEIPLYFQTDYPDTPYHHGTIASNGCGIVSLAMVATYLTGKEYLPDTLALEYAHIQGNNVQRVDAISRELGLPFLKMATKWEHAVEALQKGQIVILLVNDKSVLTKGQHFIVLTGITDEGRILINDPYEPNYTDPDLATGFVLGFRQESIAPGFDGGWIYEKQPRDPAFDAVLSEAYSGLRGRSPAADRWIAANQTENAEQG